MRARIVLARAPVALAVMAITPAAHALDCKDVPGPGPIIYGLGGSAQKPGLAKVATALGKADPPLRIVYSAPGACNGINSLLAGTKITGTASYWDATGKEQSCSLPLAGEDVDFAVMGNEATSCPGVAGLPADIGDFLGPVNAYSFIVPKSSSQTNISAAAAYFVFGFGQTGGVEPWTDESQIFRRDALSAAQLFIARATGVPADKFKGIDTKTNTGTVTAVAQSVKPEAAIGLVSSEVADANRASVRVLAYQHKGQRCAVWPDSTESSFDKKNVRNGRYHIWAPVHFFAKVNGGAVVDPDVARFVGYYTGTVDPPAGVDIDRLSIEAGAVPKCAMNVWREQDLGPLRSYQPEKPCGCLFEQVATGRTTCTACTDDAGCSGSAPVCRHGFCEAR